MKARMLSLIVGMVALSWMLWAVAEVSYGHGPGGHGPGSSSGSSSSGGWSLFGSSERNGIRFVEGRAAEPYEGQRYCPVTGERLGAHGKAIPVQYTVTEPRWGLFRYLMAPRREAVTVYVCCQGCVEQLRQSPAAYNDKVIKTRKGW